MASPLVSFVTSSCALCLNTKDAKSAQRSRSAAIAALSLLAGCAPDAPADPPVAGWSLEASGDLNVLFDCLEENGIALVSAHRGGPRAGHPENALETFEQTLSEVPSLIETDVATSADGVLYLMHDETLDRTTTGEGAADAHSWQEIKTLRLEDKEGAVTAFHPASFADALRWADGRTILKIDIKRTTRYEDVIAEIDRQQAEDRVVLIAYTIGQAEKLHRLAPGVMISLNLSSQSELNRAVAAGIPADRLIGFTGVDAPDARLFSILDGEDVEVVFGTLGGRRSIDREIASSGEDAAYAGIAAMGADIIATDRPVAAQAALDAAGRGVKAGVCGFKKNMTGRTNG